MTDRAAPASELWAPPPWRVLEFVSDVHLHPDDEATGRVWLDYLAHTQADALFILGDLFEVWVGDDALAEAEPAVATCVQALQRLSQRCAVHFMAGNRDFLAGPGLMAACGARALADPTVLVFGGQRLLLSHGDALCLDDTDYLQFRAQVRQSDWQQNFLARPLPERMALARQLRAQSHQAQARRLDEGRGYAEVDPGAARDALQAAQAELLIHGHTHRPARHALAPGLHREVLSDWDARARPPRAQVLRLTATDAEPLRLQRLPLLA